MNIQTGRSSMTNVESENVERLNSPKRIFFVSGAGDIVQSHKYWKENVHNPTQVSITFSSQVEDYCRKIDANFFAISHNRRLDRIEDGKFTLEHNPKSSKNKSGITFHVYEVGRSIKVWIKALRYGADAAILESGCMPYFMQPLFTLSGIQVVQVLHNTLWPRGFPHKKRGRRLALMLDRLYFRWCPIAVIGVSPECCRQVEQLVGPKHPPLYEMRAQFDPDYFNRMQPPPPHDQRPFSILFIGRVVEAKGIFDILEMARKIEARLPGQVKWHMCGTGPDFDRLKERRDEMRLNDIVTLHGWVSLPKLAEVYAKCHSAIVPTRSTFDEGLAMTAAEAVLAGRPVITNDIVPASSVLGDAAILATPEDTDSYVEKIIELVENVEVYERHRSACEHAADEFLDRSRGYAAVIDKVFSAHFKT